MKTALPTLGLRAVVLLGTAALAFGSGCSESSAPLTENNETPVVLDDTVPPLSDLAAEADLSDAQAEAIAPALDTWRRAAANSEAAEDLFLEDSPAIAFLSQAAAVVDREQLETVVGMAGRAISDRDVALRPDPGDRRAHLRPGIRGLFRNLDLTDEQITAIRAALAAAHESAEALCDDFQDGVITEEELLEARVEVRETLDAAILDVLTDKQEEQLEANKVEVLTRRLTRLLDRFDARVGNRIKHLDRLLDLTEDQEAAIESIMLGARPSIESLLADVEDGSVTAQEGRDEFRSIREGVRDDVRGELTAEQVEILDMLRDMNVPCGRTLHD